MSWRPSARVARLLMLVLPSVLVLAPVIIAASIAINAQERSIRDDTEALVHDVAVNLSQLQQVQSALDGAQDAGTPGSLATRDALAAETAALQPIAHLVEGVADVYYVVITDNEGVRITHPRQAERGVQVSTTNESVLAGKEYLGTETGPSGPALRAKVPVRNDAGEVVGMVAVGVLEKSIAARRDAAISELAPWTISALVVGTIASTVLTGVLAQRARRLEQASAEREQMRRTTLALREQSHEFSTHLHVVHGLVSHGDTREALDYIDGIVPVLSGRDDATPLPHRALPLAAVAALQAELRGLGAHVDVQIAEGITLDDDLMLVLSNLCRNAAEAGASRVECTLREHQGRIIGTVQDNGPGIDHSDPRAVFARGYSSKPDASGHGRGLGLDLVRRTVGGRGGTIEVGRSPHGGAHFTFDVEQRS